MTKEKKDLIPTSKEIEPAIDWISVVVSVVPYLGGPISSIRSGITSARRESRIREVLEGLATNLEDFKSEVSEEYVRTEDFEELFERTFRQVAEERNEEKRRIYRDFLADAIKSPGEPYDEQLRFLRTLEEMQPDQITLLKAINQEPEVDTGRTAFVAGSSLHVLKGRLPQMDEDRIEELVNQLNDMWVINFTSLKTVMTASGARSLASTITPYGLRFMKFITD